MVPEHISGASAREHSRLVVLTKADDTASFGFSIRGGKEIG